MVNSPNNSPDANLFCSLFGHNYILKAKSSSHSEIFKCKTCNKEFEPDCIEDISGTPKTSEGISLFRTFLTRYKSSKRRLILK